MQLYKTVVSLNWEITKRNFFFFEINSHFRLRLLLYLDQERIAFSSGM